LLASSAVPGVFTPVEIGDGLYTDGGVLDNFPVKPLRRLDYTIYGSYVCPLKKMLPSDFRRSLDVVNRAVHLKMHSLSLNKFKECEKVVAPYDLTAYHLFQSGQVDRIFEIGYEEAIKVLSPVASSL
jgi:NTE family protein